MIVAAAIVVADLDLLGGHVPTTGFSAIHDVLRFRPAHVFLTGFDFFTSGVHNVNERHKPMNPDDPIGHVPDRECQWLAENLARHPIEADALLGRVLATQKAAA